MSFFLEYSEARFTAVQFVLAVWWCSVAARIATASFSCPLGCCLGCSLSCSRLLHQLLPTCRPATRLLQVRPALPGGALQPGGGAGGAPLARGGLRGRAAGDHGGSLAGGCIVLRLVVVARLDWHVAVSVAAVDAHLPDSAVCN